MSPRPEPGQLAQIDEEARLCVPADVLRAVPWWTGEAVDVMAELAEEGLVRIYSMELARPAIDGLFAGLADLAAAERSERLAVLGDRYRTLKFYAERRLRLTKEVTQILGFAPGTRTTVFVRSLARGLEITSLAFRLARLAKTPLSLGLHDDD